jgi:hypothetical protein
MITNVPLLKITVEMEVGLQRRCDNHEPDEGERGARTPRLHAARSGWCLELASGAPGSVTVLHSPEESVIVVVFGVASIATLASCTIRQQRPSSTCCLADSRIIPVAPRYVRQDSEEGLNLITTHQRVHVKWSPVVIHVPSLFLSAMPPTGLIIADDPPGVRT